MARRVYVVPVPRTNDLPGKQESTRCKRHGPRKTAALRGDGTRSGHKPPEDGEEREAAVGEEQSYARLRQRFDRTVQGAHQRQDVIVETAASGTVGNTAARRGSDGGSSSTMKDGKLPGNRVSAVTKPS